MTRQEIKEWGHQMALKIFHQKDHKLLYPRNAAIDLIAEERQRQVMEENWSPSHDDQHQKNELAKAAACYILPKTSRHPVWTNKKYVPHWWPWDPMWWKPSKDSSIDGRIRELVKGAALVVAEIERLQRLKRNQQYGNF